MTVPCIWLLCFLFCVGAWYCAIVYPAATATCVIASVVLFALVGVWHRHGPRGTRYHGRVRFETERECERRHRKGGAA